MEISISGYIRAATPIIWAKTDEYDPFMQDTADELSREMSQTKFAFWRWDAAGGMDQLDPCGRLRHDKTQKKDTDLAQERAYGFPLRKIAEKVLERETAKRSKAKASKTIEASETVVTNVYFLLDYHEFLGKVDAWRQVQNLYVPASENDITIVIVSPTVCIPPEIADYIVVLDYAYPTAEWLKVATENIAAKFEAEIVDIDKIVNIGQGLSRAEFDQALNISIANSKDRAIRSEYVNHAKQTRIAKESVVRLLPSEAGFESIIGLDKLKAFTKGMVESGQGRGVLLLGVPGSGKSAFAATLGHETKRTALYLDFATLMGGIVGETESKTERALKLIDAMQPCVLVIDEIEKGLAGTSGHNGDSGTSRRQGALFLKWLSDHKTDVYVVATANSVVDLPPEYKRAERWDAIFFLDIPHANQARAILEYYAKMYNIEEDLTLVSLENLTGAEIKSVCRIAKSLNLPIDAAREYIKPIVDTMDIEQLRALAGDCAIMADDEFKVKAEVEVEETPIDEPVDSGGRNLKFS